MNETIDCTNCCIADFKQSLCDCHGDFCTKYKSIGDENDFMQAVLMDRPQGEWIDDGLDAIGAMGVEYRWHKCSQCGFRISKSPSAYYPNFCEACGAKMKGADDEID